MKKLIQTIALFAVIGIGTASAQNVMFVKGPTITDQGTTLQVCGKLAGLGNNQVVIVTVTGNQTITTTCTNQGGNTAPGLTKTEGFMASGQFMSEKNGTVTFCLTTNEPTPGQCPNGNFTATVTDATFSNVVIKVNGQVVSQ